MPAPCPMLGELTAMISEQVRLSHSVLASGLTVLIKPILQRRKVRH